MRGDRRNKERKAYLEKQKLINCGHCRYHRNENATHVNQARVRKLNKTLRGGKRLV